MTSLDKRPVYKNKNIEKAFKNALFYFVKYTGDCPICLEFFQNPQILPCGHCYCHSCILRSIEYSKLCPMCAEYFWIFKPAQFFFTEEIKEYVLLKRCLSSDVLNSCSFYDYPYSLEYFDNNGINNCTNIKNKNSINEFYQSNDGQLYFLDPEITRKMKSKPEYIHSKIKNKIECLMDHKKYSELSHIPTGTKIVILKIY